VSLSIAALRRLSGVAAIILWPASVLLAASGILEAAGTVVAVAASTATISRTLMFLVPDSGEVWRRGMAAGVRISQGTEPAASTVTDLRRAASGS